jgi:hypothetical protein
LGGGFGVGGCLEREIRRRREEGGSPNTWGCDVSDKQANTGARASWACGGSAQSGRGNGPHQFLDSGKPSSPKEGGEGSGRLGRWARSQGKEWKMFSFSFSNFSKEFQIDFVFLFCTFKKCTQYKILCSSMNAQSCFYPYI